MDVEKLGHLIKICMLFSIFDYLQINSQKKLKIFLRETMKKDG